MGVPSRSTGTPFTITCTMPTLTCTGSSNVARSQTVFGSKMVKSAYIPSLITPRSSSPTRAAGSDVKRRMASGSVITFRSRT